MEIPTPLHDAAQRRRLFSFFNNHLRIGEVLREQGDLSGAFAATSKAWAGLGGFEGMAAADPSNLTWQKCIAVSHDWIGDVLRAQSDLSGACSVYRKSRAIIERLAAADPSNAVWQRDLWGSYRKIADILELSGEDEAIDWWWHAYAVLSSMKAKGLFISPNDGKAFDFLRRKCGGV